MNTQTITTDDRNFLAGVIRNGGFCILPRAMKGSKLYSARITAKRLVALGFLSINPQGSSMFEITAAGKALFGGYTPM